MLSLRSNFMREVLCKDSSGKATVGDAEQRLGAGARLWPVLFIPGAQQLGLALLHWALWSILLWFYVILMFRICTFLLFSSFSKGDELDVKPILIISWIIEACMAVEGDCCFILFIYLSFLIIKYLFTWLSDTLTLRVDSTEVHLAPVLWGFWFYQLMLRTHVLLWHSLPCCVVNFSSYWWMVDV